MGITLYRIDAHTAQDTSSSALLTPALPRTAYTLDVRHIQAIREPAPALRPSRSDSSTVLSSAHTSQPQWRQLAHPPMDSISTSLPLVRLPTAPLPPTTSPPSPPSKPPIQRDRT